MSEKLLDRSQVRPAREQVRGEGVSQGVRGDSGAGRGAPQGERQPAPDV
jgi:hypothetical protein